MAPRRDPLSVDYDEVVSQAMIRAARASGQRRGVLMWIASPRGEFAHKDKGGRTPHERAFTRSAYYLIFKNGGNPGESGWSLKLTWGDDLKASSSGRLARPVLVRLFPRSKTRRSAPSWADGAGRSEPGNRIDD